MEKLRAAPHSENTGFCEKTQVFVRTQKPVFDIKVKSRARENPYRLVSVDERLNTNTEGTKRLAYTGFHG
jgi:hypothetical protein